MNTFLGALFLEANMTLGDDCVKLVATFLSAIKLAANWFRVRVRIGCQLAASLMADRKVAASLTPATRPSVVGVDIRYIVTQFTVLSRRKTPG